MPRSTSWRTARATDRWRSRAASLPSDRWGGAYDATFRIGPEVTLKRIERVQLLLGAKYWVKQK